MNAEEILARDEENKQARRDRMGLRLDRWAPLLIMRANLRSALGGRHRSMVMPMSLVFGLSDGHQYAEIDREWMETQMNKRLRALGSPLVAKYYDSFILPSFFYAEFPVSEN